jgi:hypothetical protein
MVWAPHGSSLLFVLFLPWYKWCAGTIAYMQCHLFVPRSCDCIFDLELECRATSWTSESPRCCHPYIVMHKTWLVHCYGRHPADVVLGRYPSDGCCLLHFQTCANYLLDPTITTTHTNPLSLANLTNLTRPGQ